MITLHLQSKDKIKLLQLHIPKAVS